MIQKIRPLHPGDIIQDILDERGISVDEFSKDNLQHREILLGERPMTYLFAIEIDLRLGVSSQLLINLQRKVDIWDSKDELH